VNGTFPLKEYYAKKVLSYTHYRDTMLQALHVIQPDSIRLSAAVRDYISFEAAVVADYKCTPWFYALANVPCFMLWPTLANELAHVPDLSKAYARWVNENKDESYSSAAKLAELLELFRPSFEDADGAHAKKVFLTALQYEVDFFNSVKLDE
jgi:thiaminase